MTPRQLGLAETAGATALVALALAVADLIAMQGRLGVELGGLLTMAAMIGTPLLLARLQGWRWDVLAVDPPLPRAVALGLLASAVVLPPFLIGYDQWQVHGLGTSRGAGLGLPGTGWWLEQAALQLAAIALPEELFFRGYVQGRLGQLLPAGPRILGVQLGPAALLANLGFALVHLVAVPSPHRLLVFFPGLLFAWLRARSGSAVAAAVCHACCNLALTGAVRSYG